ncbi:MAG: hypothetical protein KIS92_26130 [Planctomycetota bacterium]|nr:hypothetical protein [Planctomycetota bacterium]
MEHDELTPVGCASLLWVFVVHWVAGLYCLQWSVWILLPGMYVTLIAAMLAHAVLEKIAGKRWAPVLGAFLACALAFGPIVWFDRRGRADLERAGTIGVRGVAFEWNAVHRVTGAKLLDPRLGDAELAELLAFENLRRVDASFAAVGEAGVASVAGKKDLRELDLSFTKIGDPALARLAGAAELTVLKLQGTEITDEGVKHLAQCPNLRELDLSRTQVTPASIDALKTLASLKVLNVKDTPGEKSAWLRLRTTHKNLSLDY